MEIVPSFSVESSWQERICMSELTHRSSLGKRASYILEYLRKTFPGATTELVHRDPYQLMIATILSAQTTDVQVNKATPALFDAYPGPEEMAAASIEEIEHFIRTLGFFHSKAKYLKATSTMILERYDGKVPDRMEELITLSGVARKTANIVLAHGFGIQDGIAVDTHVKRLSGRLGLSKSIDVKVIEQDLMNIIPRSDWGLFSDLLILHGRAVCNARKPACDQCDLLHICPTGMNR